MISDFQSYQCPSPDVSTRFCWAPYVAGFSFHSGILKMAVQVDRTSADGKAVADQAAKSVANFIRAGAPPELSGVNWVVATDGAGTDTAQYSAR
jgi:hypothetical protein